MTSVPTRSSASTSVSPPEPASRPLLDLVSRFQNRLEDGDRPGHKLISAGLAPLEHERTALEARRQHLVASLVPATSDEDRKAAVAHWNQLKTELGLSNVITERTDDEIAKERAEQLRANEAVERRDAEARERAGLAPRNSFAPRTETVE